VIELWKRRQNFTTAVFLSLIRHRDEGGAAGTPCPETSAADGEYRWFLGRSVPVRDKRRKALLLVSVTTWRQEVTNCVQETKRYVIGIGVGVDSGANQGQIGEMMMRSSLFNRFSIAAALASALLAAGCARVRYSPSFYNYVSWSHVESMYYDQWEHDTHREHVDFIVRSNADMEQYWKWRQSHHAIGTR
jgi:hypothetical protein